MGIARIAITAGIALAACASPRWRVPVGYKSETLPFPLDFAPSLAHRGVEEIRFAPGFFDARAPGYFSYAFVWRIDDAPSWDALGGELTAYFRGLMSDVSAAKKRAIDTAGYATHLAAAPDAPDAANGTVEASDGFGDGRLLHLHVRARRARCDRGWLYVFAISPRQEAVLDGEVAQVAREATCAGVPAP